jgi:hypothetical protein
MSYELEKWKPLTHPQQQLLVHKRIVFLPDLLKQSMLSFNLIRMLFYNTKLLLISSKTIMLVLVQVRPSFFTIIGTEINLGVTPDSAKTLEIAFFKKLTALSDSNLTNTILTNYPDLYLYGALAESAPFLMQDERLDVWAKLYKEALRIANSSSENGRSASQNLQMSADVVV